MKKLILLTLILIQITSSVYAREVIDVFEEYASFDDFSCKTYSLNLNASKNEDTTGNFYIECDAPYSIHLTTLPSNGEINMSGNQFTYTPYDNFTGCDSFQYRISSNGVYSNISECMVTVSAENEVSETEFFYEDMKTHRLRHIAEKLVEKNIMKGERIGNKYYFFPNSQITRRSAIIYLCSALGINQKDKNSIPIIFADDSELCDELKNDSYILYSSKIITGKKYDDQLYLCPDEPLTRAEMFSIIARASSLKTDNGVNLLYPDSSAIPDYAKASVKTLISNDFITNSNKLLRPNDIATKEEFAELLYKLCEINEKSVTKTLKQRIKEGFYEKIIS